MLLCCQGELWGAMRHLTCHVYPTRFIGDEGVDKMVRCLILLLCHQLSCSLGLWLNERRFDRRIIACTARVDEEGSFRLGGSLTVPGQFPPYCSIKLRAPLGQLLRITFRLPTHFNCDEGDLLMVSWLCFSSSSPVDNNPLELIKVAFENLWLK